MNPSQRDAFNKACAWQGWIPTYPGFEEGDRQKLFNIGAEVRRVLMYRQITTRSNYEINFEYITDGFDLDTKAFSFPVNATSAEVFVAMSKILARIEQKVYELNRVT
jgi:hypothetical protein